MTHHSPIDRSTSIFLTGATGLVGGLLLRRLAERNPSRIVFALVRSPPTFPPPPNCYWITGDISEPGLGLTKKMYSHLCESAGTVVHCAASTKFTLPLPASRKVNVHGTENILELARRMKKLELLLHVSTVYIAGRLSGALHEAQLLHSGGWFSPYEQSKFEAENLVIEKGRGLPWVIARLSTVIGNSVTGVISQFNYFHQLLRLVPNNRFPFIPGEPQTPVDVIADDWVLGALEVLLRANLSPGSILHLCAGPSQALPAQQIVELAFRLHRLRQPNSASEVPRFVSLEEFQAFAKGLKRKGETALSRMAELLLLYLPHLHVQQSFLNEQTNSFLRNEGMVPPRTAEYLPRIIQSCF